MASLCCHIDLILRVISTYLVASHFECLKFGIGVKNKVQIFVRRNFKSIFHFATNDTRTLFHAFALLRFSC